MKRARKLLAACGAVVALGVSAANAAPLQLVDFKPDPAPLGFPEVNFDITTANELKADIGATGNSSVGSPGGLLIETPFLLDLGPDYAGSVNPTAFGTTQFKDVTLVLNGLAATTLVSTNIGPMTTLTQFLSDGTYELKSFDPVGDAPAVTLLKGTISGAVIQGAKGGNSAAVFSAVVTYDEGVIRDALVAAGGETTGDLSWSLLPVTPAFDIGVTPQLSSFSADLTGQFGTPRIPEPSMAGLLVLGGLGLVARRRR
jgi:hypothetical protein